jgi:hypothetical protein
MAKKESIAGNTFLFTGQLTEFTREDAAGDTVLSGVSAKPSCFSVGDYAGK